MAAGLPAEAEVAGNLAPQPEGRARDLRLAIVTKRIFAASDGGDPLATLNLLDERARMQSETLDLMKIRGWAYYHLRRFDDAARIFEAVVAADGDSDAQSALNVARAALKCMNKCG